MVGKGLINCIKLFVITNRNINLSAPRHLLFSVIRPSNCIEYGSEVWEGNKSQAGS